MLFLGKSRGQENVHDVHDFWIANWMKNKKKKEKNVFKFINKSYSNCGQIL